MSRSVVEAGNKLTLSLSGEAAGREVGYRTAKPFMGAFDGQVSYDSFSVTATGADEGWAGMRFQVDTGNLAEIKRAKTGSTNKLAARILIDGTAYLASIDDASTSGKFRLLRNGMEMSCEYDIGSGWVILLKEVIFSTSLGRLSLLAGVGALGVSVSCSFSAFLHYGSSNSLYEDHTVKSVGNEAETEPPIQITRKGHREYKNRINVQWSKREKDYVQGVVMADDIVDIDKFGVQDGAMNLDGFCTFPRASKMAWLFLRKSLLNPQGINFKLGPQSLGTCPGDILFISDKPLELNRRGARILNISEGEGYVINVEALEEDDLSDLVASGEDASTPTNTQPLRGDPGSVLRPTVYESPALYSRTSRLGIAFSRPENTCWAGSALFKALAEAGDYTRQASGSKSGITGLVSAVGRVADLAYIEVDLDYDYTLEPVATLDALLTTPTANGGMAFTVDGNKVFRYQTADLISPRKWRLSGLLFDLDGAEPAFNSYGTVDAGDAVILDTDFLYPVPDTEKFRPLYFKVASLNLAGEMQLISALPDISLTPQALSDKPMPPWGISVGGSFLDASGATTQAAGDIILSWQSRNRFGEGMYVYDRADAGGDDADFIGFILEIYNGANLLRTVSQEEKNFTYTAAMQTADGGPFSAYTFKVKQEGNMAFSDQTVFTVNTV